MYRVSFISLLVFGHKMQFFFIHETFISKLSSLTLSWRGPLPYRSQSIDFQSKSMDWFLYDNGFRHERVKDI